MPEKRNEVTTEGGLDLVSLDNSQLQTMKNNIQILAESNIKTSLFIDLGSELKSVSDEP